MRALQEVCGYDLTVVILAESQAAREWKIPAEIGEVKHEILATGAYEAADRRLLTGRLLDTLERIGPDALIVPGYHLPILRAAARWGKANGRATILLSESQRADRRRILVKELLKGWWIRRHYDAVCAQGERASVYLEGTGFPLERIWRSMLVVDSVHFVEEARSVRRDAAAWRKDLRLPDRYFLYVGRFAPEKNLERLLRAYHAYRDRPGSPGWDLVLVGSGPLEGELRALVQAHGTEGVHWAGFKQVQELSPYYALASCFVLPSVSEPWGLVVNEAMASGLPLLVSSRCGAAGNLVFSGLNGYTFDPLDVNGLRGLLERMSSDPDRTREMGEASERVVAVYTPESWAKVLADCVDVTLARRSRHTRPSMGTAFFAGPSPR